MNAVCNNLLAKYGALSQYGSEIPITVFGIIMKVNQILISILVGLASGSQPIIGYNYGAHNYKRVKDTYKLLMSISMSVGIIAFLIFQLFPQNIISIFGSESELYNEFALKAFHIFLSMCIATSFQVGSSIFLQSMGKAKQAMISSLLRQLLIFVPVAIILPMFIGVEGILFAGPIADLSLAIITLWMVIPVIKDLSKENQKQKNIHLQIVE